MWDNPIYVLLAAICLLIFLYFAIRTIAIAWFRTRLEFFRSMLKETTKHSDKGD